MSSEQVTESAKAAEEALKELEQLAGQPDVVTVEVEEEDGTKTKHDIKVRRVKTGRIPKVIRAAGPLLYLLSEKDKSPEGFNLRALLVQYPDNLLELLSVLIEKDRGFVDRLEIDDSVQLIARVLEANLDFFVHRVLPVLSGELVRLVGIVNRAKVQMASGGQKQPNS